MLTQMKRISYSRYRRIFQIMKDEPSLKRQLGKKMIAIDAGNHEMKDVPEEVVYVTEIIHNGGFDANTLSKVEVIDRAHDLLVANPRPVPLLPEYGEPTAAANGKVATAEEVEKAPKPKVKAKPVAKVKPVAKANRAEDPPEPKKQKRVAAPKDEATVDGPTAVEPTVSGVKAEQERISEVVAEAGEATRKGKYLLREIEPAPGKIEQILKDVPRVTGIAVLNLGYAMIQLFEPFMNDPEVKSLCDRQIEWLNEIHRRTILPSAEKESTAG
jgi:hypothetical protein